MAIAIGDAPVAEEEGDLVDGLRAKRDKVPEHVHVLVKAKRRNGF